MLPRNYRIAGASGKAILLDLTFAASKGPHPLVVFVHGFKGFKDWGTHNLVAQYFADNNFTFLKFNFSHNGIGLPGSDTFEDLQGFSENTISKELFDLAQVLTFARSGKEFQRPTEIYLIGHSLGGAISIIYTSEDTSIHKLTTWASISNFKTLWKPDQEQEWRKMVYCISKMHERISKCPSTRACWMI